MTEGQKKKQIWVAAQYLKDGKVGAALRFMKVRAKARKTLNSVGVRQVKI